MLLIATMRALVVELVEVGAASGTLSNLFGANAIDLNVFSGVTGTTRHYDTAESLDEETMNARIWLGIHFRRR